MKLEGDWFARSVVLVVEHAEEGAFGLVLNRPSESTVGDASDELGDVLDSSIRTVRELVALLDRAGILSLRTDGERTESYQLGRPAESISVTDIMGAVRGMQTFHTYCAARPMQFGAVEALREGGAWVEESRALYRDAGYQAADALGVSRPEGGTFLFLDVSSLLAGLGELVVHEA